MTEKTHTIGADEVGYGAISGPLVIFGVRAPNDWAIPGLNDSKKLSDKQRRVMNEKLRNCSDITFVGSERSNWIIDTNGLSSALKSCYREVANTLYTADSLIIIDGNLNFDKTLAGMDYKTIIKADGKIPAVMAASILAKVYRDDLMIKLAAEFPNYNWESNKGYGSQKHIDGIRKFGYSNYHRRSYNIKL